MQPDARPATSGPARVGVILGPEGTLRGVARVLQQVVGTGRISETDAASAVLAYAATFLNLPGTTAIMVGLRVPIPVEISTSGWVVSVAGTQALAAACKPEWLPAWTSGRGAGRPEFGPSRPGWHRPGHPVP